MKRKLRVPLFNVFDIAEEDEAGRSPINHMCHPHLEAGTREALLSVLRPVFKEEEKLPTAVGRLSLRKEAFLETFHRRGSFVFPPDFMVPSCRKKMRQPS